VYLSFKIVAARANFLTSLLARNGHNSAPGVILVCHSEEPCDEESAFHLLIEGTGGGAKQMLHGVYPELAEGFSMTQLIPNAPKDSIFLGVLCAFARESNFGCGPAAL
jgi:hypothetical protein